MCRLKVVDLMAQHNPEQSRLLGGRRAGSPVRDRRILHPSNIGHIVDMPELVDIRGFHKNRQLEPFGVLTHGFGPRYAVVAGHALARPGERSSQYDRATARRTS
jgi:hypothetical protein